MNELQWFVCMYSILMSLHLISQHEEIPYWTVLFTMAVVLMVSFLQITEYGLAGQMNKTYIPDTQEPRHDIECPFCGETEFDKEGLKHHLLCYSIFTHERFCKAFEETEEF